MSLFSYPIGRETPFHKQLTDTNYLTLVTAGANGCTVVVCSVNEIAGSTPTIILEICDSTPTIKARRANLRPMTARENWQAVTLNGTPITLLPNYILRAKASAANQIDIDGIYIEPPGR